MIVDHQPHHQEQNHEYRGEAPPKDQLGGGELLPGPLGGPRPLDWRAPVRPFLVLREETVHRL